MTMLSAFDVDLLINMLQANEKKYYRRYTRQKLSRTTPPPKRTMTSDTDTFLGLGAFPNSRNHSDSLSKHNSSPLRSNVTPLLTYILPKNQTAITKKLTFCILLILKYFWYQ